MTIAEMLSQSGVLTLLGMGIVFSFLVILIVCVTLAGKVVHALGADKDTAGAAQAAPQRAAQAAPASPARTTAVAAAISAAVTEYRKNNA